MTYRIFQLPNHFCVLDQDDKTVTSHKVSVLQYPDLSFLIEDVVYALSHDSARISSFTINEYIRLNELEPIFEFDTVEELSNVKSTHPELFI